MKKLTPWLLAIGVILFFVGALIPDFTNWCTSIMSKDIGPEVLNLYREKLSLCTTLFGWLNILLGLLCLLIPNYLERYTHPATATIILKMSVALALTAHCVISLIMQLLSHPLRIAILIVLMLVGGFFLVILTRDYIDERANMLLPTSGTFEISFAILYTIPIFLVIVAADEFIRMLL